MLLLLLLLLPLANSRADVPLPNRGIAQAKGLSGGAGLGTMRHSGCRNLWTWTTHGTYAYSPSLYAGPSIKFSGGNLDSTKNLVYQRYSVNAMLASVHPGHAMFIGPSFSFENTDLQSLMDEISHASIGGGEIPDTKCSELFSEIGSSIGYKSGIGFLVAQDWGLAFGHTLDLTLKGTYLISFSSAIAFNLRDSFEKLSENTSNAWLSVEYSASFTRKSFSIHDLILGIALGF